MTANLKLRFEDNYLEDNLQLFENCFELHLTKPVNVREQVLFNSYYFTTIPGGWLGGWVAGWIT